MKKYALLLPLILAACNPDDYITPQTNPATENNNQVPVLNVQSNQIVAESGSVVTLSATADDEDGSIETVLWQQTAGGEVTLNNANTLDANFIAPEVTESVTLSFKIRVTDNEGADATFSLSVTIEPTTPVANQAPTVSAGSDQTVNELTTVSLAASATDPDGDTLSYNWTQNSGTGVSLSNADSAQASFTAPDVSTSEVLSFSVTATDPDGLSDTDTVIVTVSAITPANQAPTVSAGSDQTVNELSSVTLTAVGSDPDGDELTYSWTQTSGNSVVLSNANNSAVSFTAPDVSSAEVFSFSVTTTDTGGLSATDSVDITVNPITNTNQAPSLNAISNQTVDELSLVALSASATDPNGDALLYSWNQTSGTAVMLSNADSAQASFTAPDVITTEVLNFTVTVTDPGGLTDSTSLSVTVNPIAVANQPPSASAGDDQTVSELSAVQLEASATDPENDTLSYFWTQTLGASVALSDPNIANPVFTAPAVTADELLNFSVEVSDDNGNTVTDTVSVVVLADELVDIYEDNDNYEQAAPVAIGETVSGVLTCDDPDVFEYTFPNQALATITSDIDFTLFRLDSVTGTSTHYSWVGAADTSVATQVSVQPETIWAKITADSCDISTDSYPYSFTVVTTAAPSDDSYEPNDSSSQRIEIPQGTTVNGTLWNNDRFAMTVPEGFDGVAVTFNVTSNNAPSDVNGPITEPWTWIKDPNGDGQGPLSAFAGPGVYDIVIGEELNSFYGTTYEFSWTPVNEASLDDAYEDNDTLSTATPLDPNTTITGVQLDDDWYQITVPAGLEFVIVETLFSHSEGDIDIELFDSTGSYVDGSTGTTDSENIYATVPNAGTYYIKVYFGDAGNDYQLSWSASVPPADDDYEDNDEPTTAPVIAPGITIDGILWDEDYFKVTIPAGQERINVSFVQDATATQKLLVLFDESENPVAIDLSGDGNASLAFDLPAGSYFLGVVPFVSSDIDGASYQLSWNHSANNYVTGTDDAYEANNTLDTATNVPMGSTITAIVGDNADAYRLDLSAYLNTTVNLDLSISLNQGSDTCAGAVMSNHDEIAYTLSQGNSPIEESLWQLTPSYTYSGPAQVEYDALYIWIEPCSMSASPDESYTLTWSVTGQ